VRRVAELGSFGVWEVKGPLRTTGFEEQEGPGPERVPPLGLVGSAALFVAGALLLFLTTQVAVPALVFATGAETVVVWFLAASIVLFGPLLLLAALLLARERRTGRPVSWGTKLWLRPMNGGDWLWAVGGLAVVGVLTAGIGAALGTLADESDLHPSFMAFVPLGPGRYWILGAWLPFFVLNIAGEEFVWRGVVLPRQEVAFGGRAWLVNGAPLVTVPRRLPVAGFGNSCADHVDTALRRSAATQHLGRGDYPRRFRRGRLSGPRMRTCLRVRTAPNPALHPTAAACSVFGVQHASPSGPGDLSWPAVERLNQCLTRAHFNLSATAAIQYAAPAACREVRDRRVTCRAG